MNFGHCDLFDFCGLEFVISSCGENDHNTEIPQQSDKNRREYETVKNSLSIKDIMAKRKQVAEIPFIPFGLKSEYSDSNSNSEF